MKNWTEVLKDATALVVCAVALIAASRELFDSVHDPALKLWNNWLWLMIMAVPLVAILWRRHRLTGWVGRLFPRSTVVRREAFQISRKYLLGREEDIDRLLRQIVEWPLIFLYGESGVGKSSLLERGLIPKLRDVPGRLPLLINASGPDWVEGPREALALALESQLMIDLRKKLGLQEIIRPSEALSILARLQAETGLTPILLFDQFDDYQTRHRVHFLDGPKHVLLGSVELAGKNPFWGEVADLLSGGRVRCLFATRSDAKIGLESVRFRDPKIYPLDPLKRRVAAELLDTISSEGAVDHPDQGFNQLKGRFLGDLETEGWVLAVQMQVAFSGLADLKYLTIGEYEKQGGLQGLEALHLASRLSASARLVEWPIEDVRTVLLAMVDPTSNKTIPRTVDELLGVLSYKRRQLGTLKDLLDKLETDDVVRRRIDPGQAEDVWQLDHDYLSHGLTELERRTRRWARLLDEKAQAHASARGPLKRWFTLLSPSYQVRLFWLAFRRKLVFGERVGYVIWSLPRLLLNAGSLLLLLAVLVWRYVTIDMPAAKLFAEVSTGEMSREELIGLWSLPRESRDVRSKFLSLALKNPANSRRFNKHADSYLVALVGLRDDERDHMLRVVRRGCSKEAAERFGSEDGFVSLCLKAMKFLGAPPKEHWALLRSALDALDSPGARARILLAGRSIVRERPFPGQNRITNEILLEFRRASSPDEIVRLGSALGLWGNSLTPGEALEVWLRLLQDPLEADHQQYDEYYEAVNVITGVFGTKELKLAWEKVLSGAVVPSMDLVVPALAYNSAIKISERDRILLAQLLLSKGMQEFDSGSGGALPPGFLLGALKIPLGSEIVQEFLMKSMAQLRVEPKLEVKKIRDLLYLNKSYSSEDVSFVVERILRSIGTEMDDEGSRDLLVLLRPIAGRLGGEQARRVYLLVEKAIEKEERIYTKIALVGILGEINSYVDPAILSSSATKIFESILESRRLFFMFGKKLDSFGRRLDAGQASRLTLELMERGRQLAEPPCGAVASLVRSGRDERVVEMLKWPTCTEWDRHFIVERLGELTGRRFGMKTKNGFFVVDIWSMARWAEEVGLDVASPPESPQFGDSL